MKTIKILLACIIVLLGISIYLLIENRKQTSIDEPNRIPETSDTIEIVTEYSSDIVNNKNLVKESEPIVTCKACNGLGHNPYEVNGHDCSVCDGKGMMSESEMLRRYEEWAKEEISCVACGGTGMSYKGRVTPLLDRDMLSPDSYVCKVCKGHKKGTRAELIENFRIANAIYGSAL